MTYSCDEYISNVTVGTINNSSGCSVGGYADYSDISTDMMIGQSYPISVTNGNPIMVVTIAGYGLTGTIMVVFMMKMKQL